MRFVNYCIPFLFTICTVSQLFWNRVCTHLDLLFSSRLTTKTYLFFFSLFVANSRSVSWLLGRDGDVQVIVIGEMDELKSSKIIYSGFGERKTASVLNNSRMDVVLLLNKNYRNYI